jgi:peptide/nickel transport system permease protein
MLRLIARRLVMAVPLVFAVSFITFVLVALTPGDPAVDVLGASASPATDAAFDRQFGFDHSVWVQYWDWLEKALQGNLGLSLLNQQSVVTQLDERLPVTLALVAGATLVAALGGIVLGTLSATHDGVRGRATDAFAMLGFAIPIFWLGVVLVDVFAVNLRLLPATGWVPLSQSLGGWLRSLLLPVLTLGAGGVTAIAKQTRDAMRETLAREFIDALRADGIAEWRIVYVHALRNAAIPILTLLGTIFVGLLGGAVIVEWLFALPGLGSFAVSATTAHDLPVIEGIAVYFALGVVIVNLVVDLLYGWLNPKVRVT